jgi:hypothetical protein
MQTTATTPHAPVDRVRRLTHWGVDTIFDGVENVLGLAPSVTPQRFTSAAARVGRAVAHRVRPDSADAADRKPPIRVVPPGPDVVTPAPPTAPAAEGAAAARAERRRPRAGAGRPRTPASTPDAPDEVVYTSGD